MMLAAMQFVPITNSKENALSFLEGVQVFLTDKRHEVPELPVDYPLVPVEDRHQEGWVYAALYIVQYEVSIDRLADLHDWFPFTEGLSRARLDVPHSLALELWRSHQEAFYPKTSTVIRIGRQQLHWEGSGWICSKCDPLSVPQVGDMIIVYYQQE